MSSIDKNNKRNRAPHKNVTLSDIISDLDYPSWWLYVINILKSITVIIAMIIITSMINPLVMRTAFYLLNKPIPQAAQMENTQIKD